MDQLINSIARKWLAQGTFIRFLDCDTHNSSVKNLAFVSLEEALNHALDWKVDWDMELSKAEVALVKGDATRPLVYAAYMRMRNAGRAPAPDAGSAPLPNADSAPPPDAWSPADDGVELVAVADKTADYAVPSLRSPPLLSLPLNGLRAIPCFALDPAGPRVEEPAR